MKKDEPKLQIRMDYFYVSRLPSEWQLEVSRFMLNNSFLHRLKFLHIDRKRFVDTDE